MLQVLFFLHFTSLELIPRQNLVQAENYFHLVLIAQFTFPCNFKQGRSILSRREEIEPETLEFR